MEIEDTMETKDTLDNEKKVYNTPELVEHGNLLKMTQGGSSGNPEPVFGGTDPAGIIYP